MDVGAVCGLAGAVLPVPGAPHRLGESVMAHETRPRSPRLTADQRIWDLGYSRGYDDALEDGRWQGEEAFQAWLLAELRDLADDVRLNLRSDATTRWRSSP